MKRAFPEFADFLKKVSSNLKDEFSDFVLPKLINEFETKVDQLDKLESDILETNRDLKIGIVGQVKAGKSSFVNALIFNGRDILPKAETPMTATLTRITYAEENEAEVTFFSQRDWEQIEKEANIYLVERRRLLDDWERRQKEANYRLERRKDDLEQRQIGYKSYGETAEQLERRLLESIPPRELQNLKNKYENQEACYQIYSKFSEPENKKLLQKLGKKRNNTILR